MPASQSRETSIVFDIRRREAGFEVIEYPSLPVTAIPCPGVFIRDLLTIALLECVEQQVPNFYRLLELLERSLDSEPPAKPQNVVSCGTGVTGIEVDLQRSTITVRGVTYRVDLAGAHFADVVVRANGSLVTGETIAAVAPLVGTRPDRVRSALPEAVQTADRKPPWLWLSAVPSAIGTTGIGCSNICPLLSRGSERESRRRTRNRQSYRVEDQHSSPT